MIALFNLMFGYRPTRLRKLSYHHSHFVGVKLLYLRSVKISHDSPIFDGAKYL